MTLNFDPNSKNTKGLQAFLPTPRLDINEKEEKDIRSRVACIFQAQTQSDSSSSSIKNPAFSTPELKKTISTYPASPPLKKNKIEQSDEELFPDLQDEKEDLFFQTTIANLNIQRAYELNGKIHTLIEQSSSKNCGGCSLLMLFTDVLREGHKIALDEDFINWFATGSLSNADELINKASDYGIVLIKEKLTKTGALSTIGGRISGSSYSTIVSITHPKIDGHWVVVDHVSNERVFLRDPKTGHAFAPDKEKFLSCIDENIEQCLYVDKISSEEKVKIFE